MKSLVLPALLLLTGCAATSSQYEPPVVDQRGVDPQKFATDQAECIERGKGAFVVGAPITACMKERGYTILVPKS